MRYVASREEMQQIDAYSINTMGIPGIVLMEKAALALEEVFLERVSTKSHVLIVTEKGNNGGDGLALGRLLLEDGYNVDFYEIGAIPHDSDSHQIQKKVLEQMEAQFLMEFPEEEYDVIVDAVFGVGLKREVAGQHREVIERMNQKKALKVAVDVPSGVDASTGQILGTAFLRGFDGYVWTTKSWAAPVSGSGYQWRSYCKGNWIPQQSGRKNCSEDDFFCKRGSCSATRTKRLDE